MAPSRRSLDLAALGALLLCGIAILALVRAHSPLFPALADEFVYIAGARRFAETGGLNALFYDWDAILTKGFPHQDVHAPGYVILLGLFMKVFPGGFQIAVAFNALCYLVGAGLVWDIARCCGQDRLGAWLSGLGFLALPTLPVYSFWAMAELVLAMTFLVTLWVAVRFGSRPLGGAVAGFLFGASFLVRESTLFGLPAIVGLLARTRKSLAAFAVAATLFLALVYAPLSAERAEGGANFWAPSSGGGAFGHHAARAAQQLAVKKAVVLALERASMNLNLLLGVDPSEGSILAVYLMVALWSVTSWRDLTPRIRGYLIGLLIGLLAMVAVLFTFYVVTAWSGYRYAMILMPAFLPFFVPFPAAPPAKRLLICFLLVVAGAWSNFAALKVFQRSKGSGEPSSLVTYVERYLPEKPERIVFRRGFEFGLKHFPTEVITSVPKHRSEFKALENAVWFDYLVLSRDLDWADGRARYERLNTMDPLPRVKVYRRLR